MATATYQFNASQIVAETCARRQRIRNRFNNLSHRRKIETRKTIRGGARFVIHNAAEELTISMMPTIRALSKGLRRAAETVAQFSEAYSSAKDAAHDQT